MQIYIVMEETEFDYDLSQKFFYYTSKAKAIIKYLQTVQKFEQETFKDEIVDERYVVEESYIVEERLLKETLATWEITDDNSSWESFHGRITLQEGEIV